MAPFRFRLDRVLGVRESAEKQRARELARAASAQSAADGAHADAQARLASRRAANRLSAGSVMTAGMLHNRELTVHAADEEVETTEAARDAATEVVTESTARYVDARRDRRVLERLRESRQDNWSEDETRRDRRAMDDVAQVQRRHKRVA